METYRPTEEEMDRYLDKLADKIDEWHSLPMQEHPPLHNYLGFTWTEYSYFVEHPHSFAHAKLLEAFFAG